MSQTKSGALGVFQYLDDAIAAARQLKSAGYTVHAMTPTLYPELQATVDPGPSGVRWVTLTGALLGIAGGATLAIWTSLDWPLITGGKEIVSLAPYLVITFESMVLVGSIFNLLAMLVFGGLPGWMRAEGYDQRFSEDRIGLWVPADAATAEKAAAVMQAEGAEEARVATG
jgi:molybdopterin-containing oxidoreductase family membrane subunit